MLVDVDLINLDHEVERRITVELPEKASLSDLVNHPDVGGGTIKPEYYELFDPFSWFGQFIPFAVINGSVKWRASYEEVSLADFWSTIGCSETRIELLPRLPEAGGPAPIDLAAIWQQFYAILLYAQQVVEVGCSVWMVVRWLYRKLRSWTTPSPKSLERVSPYAFVGLVVSRKTWRCSDLADLTGIAPRHARYFLKGFGYRWDSARKSYSRTVSTNTILAKLRQVEWHEDD